MALEQPTGPMTEKNRLTSDAQAVIDRHLEAMMKELAEEGLRPTGIVAGVLHGGETAVSWCVKDDELDEAGKPISSETIVREIAIGIELVTSE